MKWQRLNLLSASLLSIILLTGCTLEGDEKSPTVVTQSPAANSTDAAIDSIVSLTFSESILADNLTTDSLVVSMNGNPVAGELGYDATNKQLLFTPEQPFPLYQTVTVTYGPGISDLANNILASGSWQFTTVDGEWLPENDLSLPGSDANNPSVMMDYSGYGIATWIQSDGFFNAVHAAHYVPGTGWNSPGIVDIFSGGDASLKSADMNRNTGTALVTWVETNGSFSQLWGTLYTTAAGWTAPEVINIGSGDDVTSSSASFYIADDNSVDITWLENDGSFTTVWTNHFDPTQGWLTPVQIQTNTSQDSLISRLHGNNSGQLAVTWLQQTGANLYSLIAATYDAVNGWVEEELEQVGEIIAPGPVRVNSLGEVFTVWGPAAGIDTNLRYNIFTPGVGWQTNAEAIQSGGDPIGVSNLYFADDGTAEIFYSQGTSTSGYSIFTASYDGSNWDAPEVIADDPDNDNISFSISTNSQGVRVATWTEFTGRLAAPATESAIRMSRYIPGSGWEASEIMHYVPNEFGLGPFVGLADSGEALLVWRQFDAAVPSNTVKQRIFTAP